MEPWRSCFRDGIAPVLSAGELEALAAALRARDPRLVQGRIAEPCGRREAPLGACAVALAGWLGGGLTTVGELAVFYRHVLRLADHRLGDRRARNAFVAWYDLSPRALMLRELLPEVERALAARKEAAPAPA